MLQPSVQLLMRAATEKRGDAVVPGPGGFLRDAANWWVWLQASQERMAGYELSKQDEKSMWQQLVVACQDRLDGYLQEVTHTLHGRMKDR